jgi:hypothetical protein
MRDVHKHLLRIEWKLDKIINQGVEIMGREADLLAAIIEETEAGKAVVLLLDKVAEDLAEIKEHIDPDAAAILDEALAKVKANKEAWAAAVIKNTPAEDPSGDGDHVPGM